MEFDMADSFKVYGNNSIIELLSSMQKNNRMAHAFILYGSKGVGKKTVAEYIAAQLLCYENSNGSANPPCGKCKACKMILHKAHPDVITVSPSGKSENYKIGDLRPLCIDAYVAPNESERKIYIIPDCDNTPVLAQNALLKVIEEPPAHSLFIFTASSKKSFLETILSRVISLGITEATEDECIQALMDKEIDEASALLAVNSFGGNIGNCLAFLSDDELKEKVNNARSYCSAIAKKDEYLMLSSLQTSNRAEAKEIIALIINVIRDACAFRCGSEVRISCAKDIAEEIGTILNPAKCLVVIDILNDTYSRISGNSPVSLALTSLSAQIKAII